MKPTKTFDKEKKSFNIARLKKSGETFEIIINPDAAINYKNGENTAIREILEGEKILSDAQRGFLASEDKMENVFGTSNVEEVAKRILQEGEIQLTSEHRKKIVEEKRKKIIHMIHKNTIDSKTGFPHPITRIENAIEEAKIKIDNYKSEESQMNEIIGKLRSIIPIRIEQDIYRVELPAKYAHSSFNKIRSYGKIVRETWMSDGSLLFEIEIPGGLKQDFIEKLNSLTHGDVKTEFISKKNE